MKQVIEIEVNKIEDLFSNKFWKEKHITMLTHRCDVPSLDNIFDDIYNSIEDSLTIASKTVYDSLWDQLTDLDKSNLFQSDIKQFYFWLEGLNKDTFRDYYEKLENGYTLLEIIEEDLKETVPQKTESLDDQIEELYSRHSKAGTVTIFETQEHLVISSTNKKSLNDTKLSLFMAGYIIYHKRQKKLDNKTLYSYVYAFNENSSTLPICLS
jgi:hypothetical protein